MEVSQVDLTFEGRKERVEQGGACNQDLVAVARLVEEVVELEHD